MKIFKHIAGCLLMAASWYLVFAFIGWEFNPSKWDAPGRFVLILLLILSYLYYIIMESPKK